MFEDEEDQFEVSDDPAKLGKATIVINAGAIDRIIDRAAVMIVERADRDFTKLVRERVLAIVDTAVNEKIRPLVETYVANIDLAVDSESKPIGDVIRNNARDWAMQRVNAHGEPRSNFDPKAPTRLEWLIGRLVESHMKTEAGAAVADLKENARKIATDLLAQSIQDRLPKLIS